MTAEQLKAVVDYLKSEIVGLASMVTAITTTLILQATTLGLSAKAQKGLTIASVVASVIAAYSIRPFQTRATLSVLPGERREDPPPVVKP